MILNINKTKKMILTTVAFAALSGSAQITLADFETFTLTPGSAYSPTTSTPFQTPNAVFQYQYDSGFNYWSGGFAYTNDYDSVTAGFGNLYGVRALKGFNNSAIYVVGQDRAVIKTTAVPQTTVAGFYITNTTYAYKSMAKGDAFARKFGDTTGTGSGTTIPQGAYPDFFKVIVKGYNNGALKNDSVTVMLADFTFTNNSQDFILSSWQFVNTAAIGEVDSIQFFIRSTDMSFGFINTPTFFAIDNFTTGRYDVTALKPSFANIAEINVYPNPSDNAITIDVIGLLATPATAVLTDAGGKLVQSTVISGASGNMDLSEL
ncbi:MAG TPA: DUF4465 domain-containing protein, partial [Bacteroidia bacterium]|nr:DUF4465 domain-containing protein [Bacteroidia bacterium]